MKLKKFKERDNKRIGIIVFTIVCILLVSGVILYRTFAIFEVKTNQNVIKGTVQGMGDIEFAFYINDNIVKEAPSKDNKTNYVFDEENSTCTNGASVYWDYQQWAPTVLNLKETKTKCYLKFKTEYSEEILNGAVPKIEGDLVPVTIGDDGTVKKADITQEWYKYSEQRWANAVITKNSFDILGSNVHGGAEKKGDYVHLDGEDDYIDLGLANYEFKDGITLAINVKFNKAVSQAILGNWDAGGGGIYYDENDKVYTNFFINGDYQPVYSNESLNLNKYYTIIATYDNDKINLYINGIKQNQENSISGTITKAKEAIVMGANPDADGPRALGNIDVKQAAIFNRAIGDNEIQEISNNFKITNGSGLLKYVDFTNKTYEDGEVISEDNIESYFVWIPRYKYQIWNGEEETKEFTSTNELGEIDNATTRPELNKQKEIKIEFENRHVPVSNGNLKNQWLTHPAFTSFDSNGFWVGKFETGYKGATQVTDAERNEQDSFKVIIKPNVYSWRNINVSNAFYTSQGYKSNLDSHMMKNMEWGAVAYLTNSKYGRCPNGSCTEVRINNNSSYVTGSSAVSAPTCGYTTTNEICNQYGTTSNIVNSYNNSDSAKSSTTNNYYGVFDMSGGTWEYVMGVMKALDENVSIGNSGFTNVPNAKYYDSYDYSDSEQQFQRGLFGDGTKEFGPFYSVAYQGNGGAGPTRNVGSSYADDAFFIRNNYSWFIRGGGNALGTNAGIAAYNNVDGIQANSLSFRIVLTP